MSDFLNPELFQLAMSEQARPLMEAVKKTSQGKCGTYYGGIFYTPA